MQNYLCHLSLDITHQNNEEEIEKEIPQIDGLLIFQYRPEWVTKGKSRKLKEYPVVKAFHS